MTQDAIIPLYHHLESAKHEIRLLEVSPTLHPSGLVECRLSQSRLNSATKFVVLSYRWGSAEATHEILLNGLLFYVRPNLWAFLNVIREQTGMMLWIDALCINQQDIEERNQQVRIMGDIFRSASMVLSWLGPEDPLSGIVQAFDLMERVWASNNETQSLDHDLPDAGRMHHDNKLPLPETNISEDGEDKLPLSDIGVSEDDLWQAVTNLCNLPYWGRVWVVQEILLSSNNYLLHGNHALPWQIFANFVSLIDVRFQCPIHYSKQINSSMARSYAISKPYAMVARELQWRIGTSLKHDFGKAWDPEEHNLFRVLTMFGDRDCTDPLDHVYALLSLTSEGNGFPIQYGISIVDLFLGLLHFCGEVSSRKVPVYSDSKGIYRPPSQRALYRNAKYLAEIMNISPSFQRTQPYFEGMGIGQRAPSPRPDPNFPCSFQNLSLTCTAVLPGNEPPVLRSGTAQRLMASVNFDLLLHIDESTSWLLCQRQSSDTKVTTVAILIVKDSAQGRGLKLMPPGMLALTSLCSMTAENDVYQKWEFSVPPDAHLSFLKAVILGLQPD